MPLRTLLVVFALLLVSAEQSCPVALKPESESLEGVWKIVDNRFRGTRCDELEGKVVFGRGWVRWAFNAFSWKGPYTLDRAKMPKEINAAFSNRPGKWLGIYKLESGRLKICLDWERPREFSSDENSGAVLLTMERAKSHRP
jgi:uncharacterized protein (TIGR03067 family)